MENSKFITTGLFQCNQTKHERIQVFGIQVRSLVCITPQANKFLIGLLVSMKLQEVPITQISLPVYGVLALSIFKCLTIRSKIENRSISWSRRIFLSSWFSLLVDYKFKKIIIAN
jgi:hypothetical protein